MARFGTGLVLSALLTLSAAQTSNQTTAQCQAAGYTPTQCGLCPYDPTAARQCASYDAGFDDLPDSGAIPTYGNAQWPGFVVLTQTQPFTPATIGPFTTRHYAAVMPGNVGTIQFGQAGGLQSMIPPTGTPTGVGQLRYFHYACAVPNGQDPPIPVNCKITVNANCLATGATDPAKGPFKPFTSTFNYNPANVDRSQAITKTGMAYQALDFAGSYGNGQGIAFPQMCTNYSFSAEGTEYLTTTDPNNPSGTIIIPGKYPGPVVLLDDILFNQFYTQPVQPPPVTCTNQGINWAYYNSTAGINPEDNKWASFQVDSYKTKKPVYQNIYNTFGGAYDTTAALTTFYNSAPTRFSTSYFNLNHNGYIFAPQTGTYVISFSNIDDIVIFWLGKNAYTGWTRSNGNAEALYYDPVGPGKTTFNVQLTAGTYYPIRIFFGQGDGPSGFSASVTSPNGTVIVGNSFTNSPYLVRYSCDLTTAPPFPAFGSET